MAGWQSLDTHSGRETRSHSFMKEVSIVLLHLCTMLFCYMLSLCDCLAALGYHRLEDFVIVSDMSSLSPLCLRFDIQPQRLPSSTRPASSFPRLMSARFLPFSEPVTQRFRMHVSCSTAAPFNLCRSLLFAFCEGGSEVVLGCDVAIPRLPQASS